MANTEVHYFLDILGGNKVSGGGGRPEAGGGGGGLLSKMMGSNHKDIKAQFKKDEKGSKKGLGATLGIKFGIASLLKQSQVFTGFIGTIFQLMGALVDVILAPFLPILIPGIRLIASMVPHVAKYAQKIYDFLDRTIFQWFRRLPIPDWIKDNVKKALSAILVGVVMLKITGLWNVFKSLVENFIGKPIWGLLKKMFPQIDTLVGFFRGKSVVEIITSGGKAAINALIKPWWDTLLLKLMFFEKWTADFLKPLWAAIKTGAEKLMGATLDDLVRRVWTEGIQSKLVTPLMTKLGFLAGIGKLIAAPFAGLWTALSTGVTTAGDGIIARGLTAFRNLPFIKTITNFGVDLSNHLTSLANWFTDLPFIQVIRNFPQTLQNFWNNIPELVARLPVVGRILEFITNKIGGFLSKAFKVAKAGAGFVKGTVTDVVAPKLAGAFSSKGLLNAAKGLKAIPILGAIAEAGFGGWQTYKDFKKYGAKAAMGRLGLTLANVGTALIDPTGVASAVGSISSNIAMNQAYSRLLDPKESFKRDNPDLWIRVTDDWGMETWQKNDRKNTNNEVNASIGASSDRPVMDIPGF